MHTLLEVAQKEHDSLLTKIREQKPDISHFKGIPLGGNQSYEEYREMMRTAGQVQQTQDKVKSFFPQQSAVVLSKKFFRKLFSAKSWVMFRHLEDDGTTGAKFPQVLAEQVTQAGTEVEKRALKIGALVAAALTVIGTVVFSLVTDLPLLGAIFCSLVSACALAACGSVLVAICSDLSDQKIDHEKTLSDFFENNKEQLPSLLFPSGTDYVVSKFPVQISFPEISSEETKERVREVLSHASVLETEDEPKVFVLAHHKAIGVSYNENSVKYASAWVCPLIGIEYKNVVVLYPETSWGDIPEEEKMIAHLKQMCQSEGSKLFN